MSHSVVKVSVELSVPGYCYQAVRLIYGDLSENRYRVIDLNSYCYRKDGTVV